MVLVRLFRSRHQRIRDDLGAYADGTLAPSPSAIVASHLTTCASCRDECARLQDAIAMVRALPTVAAPRSYVLAAGATPVVRGSGWWHRSMLPSLASAALAASTLVATGVNLTAQPPLIERSIPPAAAVPPPAPPPVRPARASVEGAAAPVESTTGADSRTTARSAGAVVMATDTIERKAAMPADPGTESSSAAATSPPPSGQAIVPSAARAQPAAGSVGPAPPAKAVAAEPVREGVTATQTPPPSSGRSRPSPLGYAPRRPTPSPTPDNAAAALLRTIDRQAAAPIPWPIVGAGWAAALGTAFVAWRRRR